MKSIKYLLAFGNTFLSLYAKLIVRATDGEIAFVSIIVGALLCGIFIALLYGMKNTTASIAGFLTNTTVILVPVIQTFITRKLPSKKILWGVMIVSVGLATLTIGDDFSLQLAHYTDC